MQFDLPTLIVARWGMTLGELLEKLGPMGIIILTLSLLVAAMLLVDVLTDLRHARQDRARRNDPEAGLVDPLERENLSEIPWVASLRFNRRPRTRLNRNRMFDWPAELPDHSPDDDD